MSELANPNHNPAENRIGAIEVGQLIWRGAAASVEWVGGAVAGEFSQKQTTGQIVFDAVVSMFPLLGEGTAARDAIAICLRMGDDRQKAEDRWEWVKLVLCLIAVVPLLGGVLKGVGKLVVRALEKGEDLEKLAAETVMFLNRMGHGNAYQWLRQLDFMRYQGAVTGALGELLDRLTRASQYIVKHMGGVLPPAVRQYLAALPAKLQDVARLGNRMVPQALTDLNACLGRMRALLVEGTWADITVGGTKTTTREAEGRLASVVRDGEKIAHPKASRGEYRHVEGWPDLTKGRNVVQDGKTSAVTFTTIESFSRKQPIVAETIRPGRASLARVIDTARYKSVPPKMKTSTYWLPRLPESGRAWRENWAVVQKWNHNGAFIELTHIPTADELRAARISVPPDWEGLRVWRGQVSSQYDQELGRYLDGGETQLVIDFEHPHNAVLREYVKTLMAQPTRWQDVMFRPGDRVAVRAMEMNETAPKSVLQGYTTRIPATARHTVPDDASQQR